MAGVELASLTAPVSEGDPCGPDLDLEGDPDYLNFMAKAEGLLPASYFSGQDGRPFDRTSVDFDAEFEAAKPLLERTRDLRLLVILAKFHILNRDPAAFATCIEAVATLLDGQWDKVHPRGDGGDYTLRMAAIETLDDLPTVVHPLQFIPLVNHRRVGVITYRNYMTATGEIRPREDEEQPIDATTIDRALMEADLPPLIDLLRRFEGLQAAFGRIRTIWIEHAGFDQAVSLDKVTQTLGKVVALVNGIVAKRDPSLAIAEGAAEAEAGGAAAPGAMPTGPIASRAEATDALAAAADYFSRVEPSNPALLLVRQAQQLVGRSFVDVMRILVPAYVEQANIAIGSQHVFDLPIERLSAVAAEVEVSQAGDPPPEASPDEAAAAEATYEEPRAEEPPSGEAVAEPLSPEEVQSAEGLGSDGAASANPDAEEPRPAADPPAMKASSDGAATPKQRPHAATRQQAFTLLDHVAAYYRATEPTSPVPVIIDRARYLAGRDFMSLLKDFLPESALRSINVEG